MLRLENISRWFRIAGKKRMILDGVDLSLKPGELVALTGQSGCGKTTLLNIISGLTRPSKGKIILNQKEFRIFPDILSSRRRNREIGFIFQTFRLHPNETVFSNVLLPARIRGKVNREIRNLALSILKDLGLSDWVSMKAGSLSGGQKQRTAIARALINQPGLILADEPTANLDRETSLDIARILRKLADEGKTILAVTHQEEILTLADRTFELRDGKLKAGSL